MSPSRPLSIVLCLCNLRQPAAFGTRPPWTARAPRTTARRAVALPDLPFSLPNLFESASARRSQLKKDILELATQTRRGLTATDEQREEMERLFERLEALNPTPDPLVINENKPSVNGDWSLEYTTSDLILGKGGLPRVGPIVQNIDTESLSARNSEIVRCAVVNVPRSIAAELSPVNGKFTNVQFKRFMIGPISVNAPDSFRGSLDITYLDDDMRLTRGDRGNIFVLTRM